MHLGTTLVGSIVCLFNFIFTSATNRNKDNKRIIILIKCSTPALITNVLINLRQSHQGMLKEAHINLSGFEILNKIRW